MAATTESAGRVDTDAATTDAERRTRRIFGYFAWLVAAAVLVVLSVLLLLGDDTCVAAVLEAQLATDSGRFGALADVRACDEADFTSSIWRVLGFTTIFAAAVGILLHRWWPISWDADLGQNVPGAAFAAGAGVAALLGLADALLIRASVDLMATPPTLDNAALIAAIAWAKWLLLFLLSAALVATTLAWTVRLAAWVWRRLRDSQDESRYVPDQFDWSPDGLRGEDAFCIAFSGGGIRSAAFSLGCLSTLEEYQVGSLDDRHPPRSLLESAAILATVSGGGYAGTAWRIAAGRADQRDGRIPALVGNPNDWLPSAEVAAAKSRPGGASGSVETVSTAIDEPQPDQPLYERVRSRRSFLANGRGGMLSAALLTVVRLVLHVFLLLWSVGIVAWLVGRFIASPAITTLSDAGESMIVYSRLIRPAAWAFAAAGLCIVPRLFLHAGRERRALDALAGFFAFLGASLTVGLVVVPWMVVELLPAIAEILPGGSGPQSTVALALTGGLAASVWRVVQAPIRSRALYLGGILLALALVLFAMLVANEAMVPPSNLLFFPDSYWTWGLATGGFVLAMAALNPELWSMHPMYARQLRDTFANRLVDGRWEDLEPGDWPRLSDFRDAPGPAPLICAAAGRSERANTGLTTVSMTFEPDFVTLHQGPRDGRGPRSRAIWTEEYEDIFTGRIGSRRLQSILGYTAISAAAIAPSLGRLTLGTTNALIAALNLRLGVWLPNPDHDDGRRIGPHMINMYKELTGSFETAEPNVYVTDGGHWENMAFVELVRRRAKVIISVDASADEPFSFKIIREAVELARVECGVSIEFEEGFGLDEMHPGDAVRAKRNWARATIAGKGTDVETRILFIKVQESEEMPLDILRYSREDPTFPNYSTGNQMLSEAEFDHLAVLGRESMVHAMLGNRDWLFEHYTFPEPAPAQRPSAHPTAPPAAEAMAEEEAIEEMAPDEAIEEMAPDEATEEVATVEDEAPAPSTVGFLNDVMPRGHVWGGGGPPTA